jgi:hypothetical protein
MSTSANSSHRTERSAAFVLRVAIAALFIEATLWSAIRLLSFVYDMAREVDLPDIQVTPGWVWLKFVGVSVAVAAVLFLAAAGLRNGSGWPARVAQMLAIAINVDVLVRGVAAIVRFSGDEAVVAATFATGLAVAALTGIALDGRAALIERRN